MSCDWLLRGEGFEDKNKIEPTNEQIQENDNNLYQAILKIEEAIAEFKIKRPDPKEVKRSHYTNQSLMNWENITK
ncbi:hypothetical protein D3C74_91280 [compost metagenome]